MGKQRFLLLAAVATMSIAFFAPPAQAEPTFRMPDMGELQGRPVKPDKFVMGGITIECDKATYSWNAGRLRTMELFPQYSECTAQALSGFPVDFFQETCTYLLRDLKRLGNRRRWQANVTLNCSGDWTDVGWDLYETEQKRAEFQNVCLIRIPEQAETGTAELRNLPGKLSGIEVRWDFSPLEYSIFSPNAVGSSLLCGSTLGQVKNDAYYKGAAIIIAKDYSGRAAEISMVG